VPESGDCDDNIRHILIPLSSVRDGSHEGANAHAADATHPGGHSHIRHDVGPGGLGASNFYPPSLPPSSGRVYTLQNYLRPQPNFYSHPRHILTGPGTPFTTTTTKINSYPKLRLLPVPPAAFEDLIPTALGSTLYSSPYDPRDPSESAEYYESEEDIDMTNVTNSDDSFDEVNTRGIAVYCASSVGAHMAFQRAAVCTYYSHRK
jgi:hypothetical protein